MNQLDVLETFIDEIETLGYKCETSDGTEDYESEIVLIDGWSARRVQYTNSTFVGKSTTGSTETGEIHHFYTTLDVEFEIQSENEQQSLEIKNDIVRYFRKFESDPIAFHPDMQMFEIGSGGKRSPLYEPTSMKIYKATQNFSLTFVDEDVLSEDIDDIQEIQDNYSFS